MSDRKVLNRTHFTRKQGKNGWQWYWATVAPNGKSVAVGGEGYDELRGAVNGFKAVHGIPDTPGEHPQDFSDLEKFTEDHWVITQYDSPSLNP